MIDFIISIISPLEDSSISSSPSIKYKNFELDCLGKAIPSFERIYSENIMELVF